MFSNIGGKIKGLMILQFILGLLAYVAIGLWLGSLIGDLGGAVVTVIVIGVGILINWLNCIIVYGYGQMIENTDVMKEQIERLAMKKNAASSNSNPATVISPTENKVHATEMSGWRCSACNKINKTGNFCGACGKPKN